MFWVAKYKQCVKALLEVTIAEKQDSSWNHLLCTWFWTACSNSSSVFAHCSAIVIWFLNYLFITLTISFAYFVMILLFIFHHYPYSIITQTPLFSLLLLSEFKVLFKACWTEHCRHTLVFSIALERDQFSHSVFSTWIMVVWQVVSKKGDILRSNYVQI